MKEFQKGQVIKTASGNELEIIQKLGAGGQGVVYKVFYLGKELALKWYFGNKLNNKDEFYKNIQNNIKEGAPTSAFLWPLEITEYYQGSFGYLMELRPNVYKDFSSYLLAKVRFSSIEARINAALTIIQGFRVLHGKGFSYQDLNDGNFFVNPQNGDVFICDNDNVAPFGESLGIAGKCRYMAPEIVTGQKLPDIHTDRYSLAVILYLLFFMNHPLEGTKTMCPCLTEEHEYRFYGSEPVFVWDIEDTSNRPVRGVHFNEIMFWPVYPTFVKNTFLQAFSKETLIGQDVVHRITEKTWQEVFTALKDVTVQCSCGNETFIHIEREIHECMNCRKVLPKYQVMQVQKYNVVLAPNKKIYTCHILNDSEDFKSIVGEVVTSINNPDLIGLKNLSDVTWTATLPTGESREYNNGQIVKIEKGIKISFGDGNIAEIV